MAKAANGSLLAKNCHFSLTFNYVIFSFGQAVVREKHELETILAGFSAHERQRLGQSIPGRSPQRSLMPTALLTLGRLPKALAMARALRTQGYRVLVAEPFAWHVSRVSRDVARSYTLPPPNTDPEAYSEALLNLIQVEDVDLVVPISEEAHYVLPIRNRLPSHVTLIGPDSAVYNALANKAQFIERASGKNLPVPVSARANSPLASEIARQHDYITKPVNGCSGIAVEHHLAGQPLLSLNTEVLVQAKREGPVVSSLSLVRDGNLLATAVYRGQIYAGTVAICFEREATDTAARVERWITTFMQDLSYSGFIAFDFIIDTDGTPYAIECNPRLTSGIHFFEASSLGAAVSTRTNEPPKAHEKKAWQWRYSTLTEAYGALFAGNFKEFRRRIKLCWSVADVVWSWRDPLPFILMTPLSWPILKPAIFEGITLGEACQRDIAPLWLSSADAADIKGVGNEA